MFVKYKDDDAESYRLITYSLIRNTTPSSILSSLILVDVFVHFCPNRGSVSGYGFPLGQGSWRMGRFEEDARVQHFTEGI